jgi:TolA-binding protein
MTEDELIDSYLKNDLDVDQQSDFEKQLHTNEDLRKKLALRKLIKEGIGQGYAEKLKEKLVAFDKTLEGKKRFQFSWKMAAVFGLMITASAAIYLFTQKPDPYDFDIPESGLPITMGTTQNIAFNNAMSAFKMGDYETSGKAFSALLTSQPENDTILYFSGLCDFKLKQNTHAIEKWKMIGKQSAFSEKAEYRLAIAYWIAEDKTKAAQILNQISSSSSSEFQKEAKQALQALE